MGKTIDGKYIYSMDDCRCEDCMHYDRKAGGCQAATCCCTEEKQEAVLYFPPDGFGRQRQRRVCRG